MTSLVLLTVNLKGEATFFFETSVTQRTSTPLNTENNEIIVGSPSVSSYISFLWGLLKVEVENGVNQAYP
jgi:hypothetical protein